MCVGVGEHMSLSSNERVQILRLQYTLCAPRCCTECAERPFLMSSMGRRSARGRTSRGINRDSLKKENSVPWSISRPTSEAFARGDICKYRQDMSTHAVLNGNVFVGSVLVVCCWCVSTRGHSQEGGRDGDTSFVCLFVPFYYQGFLPSAMKNYLSLLGWNDGTEKEIFTEDELNEAFDLRRVVKSAAVFDMQKLK